MPSPVAVALTVSAAPAVIVATAAVITAALVVAVVVALFTTLLATLAHMLVIPTILHEVHRHAAGLVAPAVA